jgi:hypothetical protein
VIVEHSRMGCQLMAAAPRRRHRICMTVLAMDSSEAISHLKKEQQRNVKDSPILPPDR